MESELGLRPPAAKRRGAATRTIIDLGGDLLLEILVLLPSLPSLVRAALACRAFLHAVRSCPAFRRRFEGLHPPQILGFFLERTAFPTFAPLRSRSDPDLAAAVRGSDFFLTRLPQDSGAFRSGWGMSSCHAGYVVMVNQTTRQMAAYNPLTKALDTFPMPPVEMILPKPCSFESHFVISQEEGQQVHFRLLFVQLTPQVPISVAVFSSATREWRVLPPPIQVPEQQPEPQPENGEEMLSFYTGTQLNGSIHWKHTAQAYLLLLNMATMQFSRVDLPLFMKRKHDKLFSLGQSKDGKLCAVGLDTPDARFGTLVPFVWRAGADGVEKWMLGEVFPLYKFIDDVIEDGAMVFVELVIDGLVYLSVKYDELPESLISLCLETGELTKLFDDTYTSPAFPYIMRWPPSLVHLCNKASPCLQISEDSETKVTADSAADTGPVCSKENPSVLVVGSQSYKV